MSEVPDPERDVLAVLVDIDEFGHRVSSLKGEFDQQSDAGALAAYLQRQRNVEVYAFADDKASLPAGTECRTPSWEAISDFLLAELPHKQAKLLWVHFATHGLLEKGHTQHIVLREASVEHCSTLAVPDLLSFLRASHLKLGRVLVTVDCCREDVIRAEVTPRPVDFRFNQAELFGREQFVVFAASFGEVARQRDGIGLFTERLLEALMRYQEQLWPPDFESAMWSVIKGFQDQVEDGDGQVPTYMMVRNWDENTRIYEKSNLSELWMRGGGQHSPLLSAYAIKGLHDVAQLLRDSDRFDKPSRLAPFQSIPTWSDVAAGYTVERRLTQETLEWLSNDLSGPRARLVTAPSGTGKTTFLKQVALSALARGFTCYWTDAVSDRPEKPERLRGDKVLLVVDKAANFDWKGWLEAQGRSDVSILGAEQDSAWTAVADQRTITPEQSALGSISGVEVDRFDEKLCALPKDAFPRGVRWRTRPIEDRKRILGDPHGGDLLEILVEIQTGKNIQEHVADELARILSPTRESSAQEVDPRRKATWEAAFAVAWFGVLDYVVPWPVIAGLPGSVAVLDNLDEAIETFARGLIFKDQIEGITYLRLRHRRYAEAVLLSNPEFRYKTLSRLMSTGLSANPLASNCYRLPDFLQDELMRAVIDNGITDDGILSSILFVARRNKDQRALLEVVRRSASERMLNNLADMAHYGDFSAEMLKELARKLPPTSRYRLSLTSPAVELPEPDFDLLQQLYGALSDLNFKRVFLETAARNASDSSILRWVISKGQELPDKPDPDAYSYSEKSLRQKVLAECVHRIAGKKWYDHQLFCDVASIAAYSWMYGTLAEIAATNWSPGSGTIEALIASFEGRLPSAQFQKESFYWLLTEVVEHAPKHEDTFELLALLAKVLADHEAQNRRTEYWESWSSRRKEVFHKLAIAALDHKDRGRELILELVEASPDLEIMDMIAEKAGHRGHRDLLEWVWEHQEDFDETLLSSVECASRSSQFSFVKELYSRHPSESLLYRAASVWVGDGYYGRGYSKRVEYALPFLDWISEQTNHPEVLAAVAEASARAGIASKALLEKIFEKCEAQALRISAVRGATGLPKKDLPLLSWILGNSVDSNLSLQVVKSMHGLGPAGLPLLQSILKAAVDPSLFEAIAEACISYAPSGLPLFKKALKGVRDPASLARLTIVAARSGIRGKEHLSVLLADGNEDFLSEALQTAMWQEHDEDRPQTTRWLLSKYGINGQMDCRRLAQWVSSRSEKRIRSSDLKLLGAVLEHSPEPAIIGEYVLNVCTNLRHQNLLYSRDKQSKKVRAPLADLLLQLVEKTSQHTRRRKVPSLYVPDEPEEQLSYEESRHPLLWHQIADEASQLEEEGIKVLLRLLSVVNDDRINYIASKHASDAGDDGALFLMELLKRSKDRQVVRQAAYSLGRSEASPEDCLPLLVKGGILKVNLLEEFAAGAANKQRLDALQWLFDETKDKYVLISAVYRAARDGNVGLPIIEWASSKTNSPDIVKFVKRSLREKDSPWFHVERQAVYDWLRSEQRRRWEQYGVFGSIEEAVWLIDLVRRNRLSS